MNVGGSLFLVLAIILIKESHVQFNYSLNTMSYKSLDVYSMKSELASLSFNYISPGLSMAPG